VTGAALVLVVAAAGLHAAWNALAKGGRDQVAFLWSAVTLATLLFLPVGLWWIVAEGLPVSALPFLVATIVLHALYFYALGRSYRSGDFSVVYPMARGLGVALVPVVALVLFDERLSPLGTVGVALVVAGIVALQLTPRALGAVAASPVRLGPGTPWALATGLAIASYSLVDKVGVTLLHPLPYLSLMGVGMVVLLAPATLARPGAVRREWALNWPRILVASTLNLTSYLLVLFAFRLAKVGYVVAARELSILLSALIGSLWFKEGPLGPRLLGAVVVLAGVVCVALAR
jgi:drug/metabolite transporter (DMT)-like permease